jgi:hypothetical protein
MQTMELLIANFKFEGSSNRYRGASNPFTLSPLNRLHSTEKRPVQSTAHFPSLCPHLGLIRSGSLFDSRLPAQRGETKWTAFSIQCGIPGRPVRTFDVHWKFAELWFFWWHWQSSKIWTVPKSWSRQTNTGESSFFNFVSSFSRFLQWTSETKLTHNAQDRSPVRSTDPGNKSAATKLTNLPTFLVVSSLQSMPRRSGHQEFVFWIEERQFPETSKFPPSMSQMAAVISIKTNKFSYFWLCLRSNSSPNRHLPFRFPVYRPIGEYFNDFWSTGSIATITVISPSDESVTRGNANFESIKCYSVNDRDQVQSSKSPPARRSGSKRS